MTMTPQDAIAKLSELETPAEIRRLFGDLGIKAMRGLSRYCAIAEYVYQETGKRPTVRLAHGYIPNGGCIPTYTIPDSFIFEWSHTQAMSKFVCDFDAGLYPELEI